MHPGLAQLAHHVSGEGVAARSTQPQSVFGVLLRRAGVKRSNEWVRIAELPQREWEQTTTPAWVAELSSYLRTPQGAQTLRPVQAAALTELHDYGGVACAIRVGGGKTHISWLAGTVLGAPRTLVLQPAKLQEKTLREFEELRQHWQAPPGELVVETYNRLSRAEHADMLERYQPTLIVFDEAHKLKRLKAAVTARVKRYIHAKLRGGERVNLVILSGTPLDRSLRDMWHLLMWAMPYTIPLPRAYNELQDWADATDAAIEESKRIAPGALLELGAMLGVAPPANEQDELRAARQAVGRRMQLTPGYVSTSESFTDVPLTINLRYLVPPKEVEEALHKLRTAWETPNGDLLTQATEVWRYATQLVCGFWYQWDPVAPEWWLLPRRAWHKFVREKLKHNRRKLDSPLQIAQEVVRGGYPEGEHILHAWMSVARQFRPNPVARWYSTWHLEYVRRWMQANPNSLVWVYHQAYGVALENLTGVPFFGEGGRNRAKQEIELHKGAAIVSVRSNAEGRNLQRWSSNLLVAPPTQGSLLEQLLGRTHRDMQTRHTFATVLGASPEQFAAWQQCERDAINVKHTLGQEQKLLYALRG